MSETNGNGNNELPANRVALVEAGLAQFQSVAAERDRLEKEVADLRSDLAAQKVVNEAMAEQINTMQSHVSSMMLIRDQAVADRAVYETLFISFQSQLRAFQIPAAPLVRETPNANAGNNTSDSVMHDIIRRGIAKLPEQDRSQENMAERVPPLEVRR